MLSEIASLLVQALFGLFVFVVLLRFWMQVLRAPFRNPVGQFVTALSNWIVLPVRRVIPGLLGIDLATVLIAWLAEALTLLVLLWLHGGSLGASPGAATVVLFGMAFLELIRLSLYLLIGVVIVQVIISWVNPHAPMAGIFDALTRPFYGMFRRFVPPIGGIDLSPLFVLLLAQIMLIVLAGLTGMAMRPL
ncbi:MAG TPA: YggT family protein [Burkholderiales bacterium]|nr:YggT family protein [Burkholderiales bacterium]